MNSKRGNSRLAGYFILAAFALTIILLPSFSQAQVINKPKEEKIKKVRPEKPIKEEKPVPPPKEKPVTPPKEKPAKPEKPVKEPEEPKEEKPEQPAKEKAPKPEKADKEPKEKEPKQEKTKEEVPKEKVKQEKEPKPGKEDQPEQETKTPKEKEEKPVREPKPEKTDKPAKETKPEKEASEEKEKEVKVVKEKVVKPPKPVPVILTTDKNLEPLVSLMVGRFSSAQQADNDSTYFNISLVTVPVMQGRTDGFWMYVEQALSKSRYRPYRQRVYQVQYRNGYWTTSIYLLKNPDFWINAQDDTFRLNRMRTDSLIKRNGCDIMLRRNNRTFSGKTDYSTCPSEVRGAVFATSEVTLQKDKLVSWEKGFSPDGKQVWGAEKGGYIFLREGANENLFK